MHAEKSATHWLKETLLNSRISWLDYCLWIYRIAVSVWTTSIYELCAFVCGKMRFAVSPKRFHNATEYTQSERNEPRYETNKDKTGGFCVCGFSVCLCWSRDGWLIYSIQLKCITHRRQHSQLLSWKRAIGVGFGYAEVVQLD